MYVACSYVMYLLALPERFLRIYIDKLLGDQTRSEKSPWTSEVISEVGSEMRCDCATSKMRSSITSMVFIPEIAHVS